MRFICKFLRHALSYRTFYFRVINQMMAKLIYGCRRYKQKCFHPMARNIEPNEPRVIDAKFVSGKNKDFSHLP